MKNSEVIDKFLNKDFGYKASNLYSKEDKIVNYNTVLAQWFNDILLINITKYSITSSRNQNALVYGADKKGIKWYTVSDIGMNTNNLTYKYNG